MEVTMPFIVFCKGSSTLVIRNLNYRKEIVTLNLEDDYFVCFTTMRKEILDEMIMPGNIMLDKKLNSSSFLDGVEKTKQLSF